MAKEAFPVETVGRYRVSPPPNSVPQTTLPLTFFDIPWLFFSPTQPLFFFDYPYPISHFLSVTLPPLVDSLSLTLRRFFPFAVTLVCPPDSSAPQIVYDEPNFVSLLVAQSNDDFSHLYSDHQRRASEFYPLLPPFSSTEQEEIPLLAVQVTVFSNAGICIGFTYHNVVADGRTFNSFIKTWASLFKDPSLSIKSPSLPFYDRTVIKDGIMAKGCSFRLRIRIFVDIRLAFCGFDCLNSDVKVTIRCGFGADLERIWSGFG